MGVVIRIRQLTGQMLLQALKLRGLKQGRQLRGLNGVERRGSFGAEKLIEEQLRFVFRLFWNLGFARLSGRDDSNAG